MFNHSFHFFWKKGVAGPWLIDEAIQRSAGVRNEVVRVDEDGTLVDGKFLSTLHFADDFVLLSNSTVEAEASLLSWMKQGKG